MADFTAEIAAAQGVLDEFMAGFNARDVARWDATFKMLFNGYEAKCAPAPNNPAILTCNYPPSMPPLAADVAPPM